jgi:hypothetical protein
VASDDQLRVFPGAQRQRQRQDDRKWGKGNTHETLCPASALSTGARFLWIDLITVGMNWPVLSGPRRTGCPAGRAGGERGAESGERRAQDGVTTADDTRSGGGWTSEGGNPPARQEASRRRTKFRITGSARRVCILNVGGGVVLTLNPTGSDHSALSNRFAWYPPHQPPRRPRASSHGDSPRQTRQRARKTHR